MTSVDGSGVEGIEELLGSVVTLVCAGVCYTGKLGVINKNFIKLEQATISWEFDKNKFKEISPYELPYNWYVQKSLVLGIGAL